jgi:hypothetical protein
MVLVATVFESRSNRFEAVLAADNLQRMSLIKVFRVFCNDVAETTPLLGILLHCEEGRGIDHKLAIGTVKRLVFGI